ncbi:MAG: cytochrome P450 [Novosphingobium sp.]|jgi:cytochrome P450|nr:cytochrome P450 [Novosphingobium sp.]
MADFDKQDFFTDPAIADDNTGYVAHMRSKCPVLREPHHGVFMVTGYDAALEVLGTRSGSFSSAVAVTGPIPPLPFTPHGDDIREQVRENRPNMVWTEHLATMDGEEHAKNRALIQQLLTHKRLKANENFVAGLVIRLVDAVIDKGACEITEDFAHALSTLVIADLLGVPEEEHAGLIDLIGLPPTQMGGDAGHKVQADPLTWLHDRFRGYLLDRKANPRDDMMTDLVQSRYKDGSEPTLERLTRLACFLFGAGQDTSARLVAFSFRVLGDQPEIQAQLRAEPERIPDFIEEVLRMYYPVKTLSRLAVEPTEVAGVAVPVGAILTINTGGANHDPHRFPDPERFDFNRPNVRDHISFSRGSHACLGAPLARMEVRVALEQFLSRTSDIRISEAHHGPRESRRYACEPTYLLSGLQALHVEWDKA